MAALADGVDGRLGGADQFRDLRVRKIRLVPDQPGDGVGTVLALRQGRIPCALGARLGQRDVGFRHFHPGVRNSGATVQLFLGQLAAGYRVKALHAGRHLAVGDGLDFQIVEAAKSRNLLES